MLKSINRKISTLTKAERLTKALLGDLSRELLEYVVINKTWDIDSVNRTLAALTPMNKRTAILYFQAFLPFKFDEQTSTFGKLNKKVIDTKADAIIAFLDDESQNIWSWAADNVKVEAKAVDYAKNITKWVAKAIEAEDGLTKAEVLDAIFSGGLSADDFNQVLADIVAQEQPAQEAA